VSTKVDTYQKQRACRPRWTPTRSKGRVDQGRHPPERGGTKSG